MPGLFISYRREDSAGYAGRLYDRLHPHFGTDQVFMDVGAIAPGADFEVALDKAMAACDTVLVVIGPRWLDASGPQGRRLDAPKDYVRQEVATAIVRNARVVPVLVGGAKIPDPAQLPDELKPLVRRQAATLADDHWDSNINDLLRGLDRRAPGDPGRLIADRRRGWRGALLPWLVSGVVALAVAGGYEAWRRATAARTVVPPPATVSLQFTPLTLDFGPRRVNTSSVESVTITNTGRGVATLREVLTDGGGSAFTVSAGACVGNTLVAGEQCKVDLYFVPRAAGRHDTRLTVVDADGRAHDGPRITGEGSQPSEPGSVEVPQLAKLSFDRAYFVLADAGLTAGTVRLRASTTAPSGTVLQQLTAPGKQVPPRTAIDFVVAVPPANLPRPAVRGEDKVVAPAGTGGGVVLSEAGTPLAPLIVHFVYDAAGQRLCYGMAGASSARIEPAVGEVRPAAQACVALKAAPAPRYTLSASGGGQTVRRVLAVP